MTDLTDEELARALASTRPPEPPPEVGRVIVEAVTRDLRPARGASPGARAVYSVVAAVVVVGFFIVTMARGGVSGSTLAGLAWGVVFTAVVVGVGSRPGRGLRLGPRMTLLFGVPAVLLAVLLAGGDGAQPLGGVLSAPVSRGALVHCAAAAMFMGLCISGIVIALWSRTDPFAPGLTGALAGLAGGLAGAVATDLVCPIREAWHLGLGHASVVVAMAALGWGIGRRALRP